MTLSVVILAAGQGKRMKSDLPKVLQPLAGKPLLGHVLDAAEGLRAAATYVVYGHGGEQVPAAFEGREVRWALQAEQHGTGGCQEPARDRTDHRCSRGRPRVAAVDLSPNRRPLVKPRW